METLMNFLRQAGAKSGLYFLYICAQIFVLASLLLTTTGIAVHLVLMTLTIGFYFATALKDPGVYIGAVQPNHEDANISKPQIKISKQISVEKRWQSQKYFDGGQDCDNNSKKSKRDMQNNQKNFHSIIEQDIRTKQKKPSILKILEQKEGQKNLQSNQRRKVNFEQDCEEKIQKKKEILHMALAVFNNFAIFKSKKQIDPKVESVQVNSNKNQFIENKINENIQKLQVPVENNEIQLSKLTSKQQGENSMVGKEDFAQLRIQSNLSPQIQLKKQKLPTRQYQVKSIVERVSQIKRYCRICEIYQPLRVRHCHNCDKCIATFDHHCPWMANCIGQKNKLYFIAYLILQTLQLFTIMIDLICFLSVNVIENSGSVGILLTAVILLFVLLVILLCFHLYLICKNITTWQLLCWDKIEYLSIFDKTKLTSPFNKGLKENLKRFWNINTQSDLQDWKTSLTEELSQFVIRRKKHTKTQMEQVESDRRPFKSQRLVRN